MEGLVGNLLKSVSRSFYLSLRLLPSPMRPAASLGYLLARTSDTLADTSSAPLAVRQQSLTEFSQSLLTRHASIEWSSELTKAVKDPREQQLLAHSGEILAAFNQLPPPQTQLVRKVCQTIINGQMLDLSVFATASAATPCCLADDFALENYTYQVAGCVGEFWTQLGFLTLGKSFSHHPQAELLEHGKLYGQGLQLVNILRDREPDLAAGRCYLPTLPTLTAEYLKSYRHWFTKASEWIHHGKLYSATLESRRLRMATILPAHLAEKTLSLVTTPTHAVKISRKEVYLSLAKAFLNR